MYVQQLYTNCLAEAAYYIESNGEAAVIDPIREIDHYIELANFRGAKIKFVFETHFHADFVSGHIDLAQKTGAQIVYGPMAETAYKVYNAKDGEEFKLGNSTIRTLHTPGHTPESTCYLLLDENNREYCIFTGDTLFVGDVGRPDLLDGKMTKEELAGMMYDSLNKKLKLLPDDVIVYPAHGPGSSCGKNLGKETWSTIGQQKAMNYAMQDMSREQFIAEVTDGLTPPPAYFFADARINKNGYHPIAEVMNKNKQALTVTETESMIGNGAQVLDTRNPEVFEKGFIPGAINIGLNGTFAVWVGTVIDINRDLIIVAEDGKQDESIMRLARVGYERVLGFLEGGMDAWISAGKKTDTITSIEPYQFADKVAEGVSVLDVRKISEAESGHIKNACVLPLADINKNLSAVSKTKPVYVHCAGGYRSMIAASLLKSKGYHNIINVHEGWAKIKTTGVPVETGIPESI